MQVKTVFLAACLRAFGAAAAPDEAYLKRVQELVAQQRRKVERLKAPSELVAEALFAGGAFYLGGSDAGWIREGSGRSGGVMNIGQLSPTTTVYPGDVVWLNYAARTYDAQLQTAAELERKQCLVMAFGPRPASGVPGFQHWIDSLTPWNADQNFTVLGNVLSLNNYPRGLRRPAPRPRRRRARTTATCGGEFDQRRHRDRHPHLCVGCGGAVVELPCGGAEGAGRISGRSLLGEGRAGIGLSLLTRRKRKGPRWRTVEPW